MSDENGVAEVTAPAANTPDLETLYAAVAHGGGKWKVVKVRPDHGGAYQDVLRYFSSNETPVRLFNASSQSSAVEVAVNVLQSSADVKDVKYVGAIDPLLYEGPRL